MYRITFKQPFSFQEKLEKHILTTEHVRQLRLATKEVNASSEPIDF